MAELKKYVLAGGPCSGKTTVINALAKEGYLIVPEAARMIIEEMNRKGGDVKSWEGNVHERQVKILELQLKLEKEVEARIRKQGKGKAPVFFDHGIPSGIPFYMISNTKVPARLLEESMPEKRNYTKIFFFEFVPYQTDNVRKEPEEIAKKIAELTRKIYTELGYPVINVPAMPVEERIKFIKENLQ